MATATQHPAVSELTEDGDTFELEDGRTLRLKIENDPDYSINDYDSDGKVSDSFDYIHDGHKQRPAGFDGRAVKIETGRGSWAWWQPCEDAVYATPAEFQKDKQRIADLVAYGFVGVIVELLEGKDAYGRPIVRNTASLWGVEWNPGADYLGEIVSDLISELGL